MVSGWLKENLSIGIIAVLINFVVWHVGILFNYWGGLIDEIGAGLCRVTFVIAIFLIPLTIIYSFLRRYIFSAHRWDRYGPILAIVGFSIIYLEYLL